jgi:molybdate transport system substrate-binding protein
MSVRAAASSFAVIAALLAAHASPRAQAAPLRMFMSNGYKAVFDELKRGCEQSIGRTVTAQFGTSTALIGRINAGEPFDVAIMTTEAMEEIGKSGKVGARTALGRSGIGIGVRSGARKPDIRTPDALKAAFLGARSIAYAGGGASRPHIERMMTALGIADVMTKKTILEPDSVRSAEKVASGEAELLITLVSEILPAPGVDLVGPLPMQFQNYVSFAAGTGAKAVNPEAGNALITCISGPGVAATLSAKGMELVGGRR